MRTRGASAVAKASAVALRAVADKMAETRGGREGDGVRTQGEYSRLVPCVEGIRGRAAMGWLTTVKEG
jgi:hypothetical protein